MPIVISKLFWRSLALFVFTSSTACRLGFESIDDPGSLGTESPFAELGDVDLESPESTVAVAGTQGGPETADAGAADAAPADAASETSPPDAGIGPAPVPGSEPWTRLGIARRIDALSVAGSDDNDPSVTGDLLELYFGSDRPGSQSGDIWRSVRAARSDPWGAPVLVAEVSSRGGETDPEVSADGLTLYLASDRLGRGDNDLFVSTRPDRGAQWGVPVRLDNLSSTFDDYAPTANATRSFIVFASVRGSATREDLFGSSVEVIGGGGGNGGGNGTSATIIEPIAELNTSQDDAQPQLSPDGLRLAFASNRTGGVGGRDIYVAVRASTRVAFQTPIDLYPTNTSSNDEGPWLSSDGTYLLFGSDRAGDNDLYEVIAR